MLKRLLHRQVEINEPAIITIHGSISIFVDADKNIFIEGHDKIALSSKDEITLDAKNVNILASDNLYLGSKKLDVQSERIDLNKEGEKSGYKK